MNSNAQVIQTTSSPFLTFTSSPCPCPSLVVSAPAPWPAPQLPPYAVPPARTPCSPSPRRPRPWCRPQRSTPSGKSARRRSGCEVGAERAEGCWKQGGCEPESVTLRLERGRIGREGAEREGYAHPPTKRSTRLLIPRPHHRFFPRDPAPQALISTHPGRRREGLTASPTVPHYSPHSQPPHPPPPPPPRFVPRPSNHERKLVCAQRGRGGGGR